MPTGPVTPQGAGADIPRTRRTTSTHWLYVAVLGTALVNLINMMIGPITFCTTVLGIGSVHKTHPGRARRAGPDG